MKAWRLTAEWEPKKEYKLSPKEKEGRALSGNSIYRNPQLRMAEVPKPEPGPGEILLRVKACGICGTDVHFVQSDEDGYMAYPGLVKLPITPGHEFAGIVEEVGVGVTDFKEGDLVTSEEVNWCGHCYACRGGYYNFCENVEDYGITLPGAFAEYIVVNSKYAWKINRFIDVYGDQEKACEVGALIEPTSVAYEGLFTRAGGIQPGGSVAVFGTGPIGLASIALIKSAGAGKILAFDISRARLELAKSVGADYTLNPDELRKKSTSPHEEILRITEGRGAAMLVEAAGAFRATIPEIMDSLAINGKILVLGRDGTKVPMGLLPFQDRGAQLYGSLGHAGHHNFPSVIELVAQKKIDLSPIITSRYPLEESDKAIQKASKLQDGKIMVKP